HHGGPRPGAAARRGPARCQGPCHARPPRGLRPPARGRPAAALPDGGGVADEQGAGPEGGRAPGKMSFMEHLGELRTRIMWSLLAAGIGIVIALFITDPVMRFISRPLLSMKTDLVFTSPTEAFWTWMKVAMMLGIFISMPGIL